MSVTSFRLYGTRPGELLSVTSIRKECRSESSFYRRAEPSRAGAEALSWQPWASRVKQTKVVNHELGLVMPGLQDTAASPMIKLNDNDITAARGSEQAYYGRVHHFPTVVVEVAGSIRSCGDIYYFFFTAALLV